MLRAGALQHFRQAKNRETGRRLGRQRRAGDLERVDVRPERADVGIGSVAGGARGIHGLTGRATGPVMERKVSFMAAKSGLISSCQEGTSQVFQVHLSGAPQPSSVPPDAGERGS